MNEDREQESGVRGQGSTIADATTADAVSEQFLTGDAKGEQGTRAADEKRYGLSQWQLMWRKF